ncbi:hypothetical protein HPB47_008696, partial [Ixodes persulcatus]
FVYVKPFCSLVSPKLACTIIGYVSAGLAFATSLAAFMRVIVASSDSRIIPENQGEIKVNYLLFLFPGIYCLLHVTTCVLLIWGVKIERAQLVLPWVVMGIIDIVLSIVGMAVLGIAATSGGEQFGTDNTEWLAAFAGLCAVFFIMMVYFTLCVLSYFEELVKKPDTNFFKGRRRSSPHIMILDQR